MNQESEKSMAQHFFRASAADFEKIPGGPIAYWLSDKAYSAFEQDVQLREFADPRQGLATSDNAKFVRFWHEVSLQRIGFNKTSRAAAEESGLTWFPFNKGGSFRKWAGNYELVVNWGKDGADIKNSIMSKYTYLKTPDFVAKNPDFYFREGLSWSALSSGLFSLRDQPAGFIFADKGQAMFPYEEESKLPLLGLMNSAISRVFLEAISPTLDFNVGYIAKFPTKIIGGSSDLVEQLIAFAALDWNAYETSWDFTWLPLLKSDNRQLVLKDAYQELGGHWQGMMLEMQRLEEENNRIFIDAYDLKGELKHGVPLKEITLTCNPHYRYGGDKTEAELEAQLQADTMAEFLSYAVGCMFGRYSLDKPGLVLANQGDSLAEYLRQVPEPRFMPDEDNVIPLLDGEWFADDVTERFRTFLRVTFGEEHYEENLAFIEASLGKDVRKYFIKDFYADHVKRYKKRPIYWLFASPKGTFSALIYLHRYRPDTVSVVLQYLRDFRKKLAARLDYLQQVSISISTSQGEKTRALKEIETLKKQLLELDDYERDTLYPLATEQVVLDLDNGVKANYLKLGSALKKIVGLDAKGDE